MRTGESPQPWDQLRDESGQAYRAFLAYRDLGLERTVAEAARRLAASKGQADGKASSRHRIWAKEHRWVERAGAYDRHLEASKVRGEAKAIESYAAKRRRQALENEDFALAAATQLKVDALTILKSPHHITTDTIVETDAEGRAITIHRTIEPAGWRRRDAAFMLRTARDLEDTVFHFSRRENEQEVSTQADAGPRAPVEGVQSIAMARIQAHRAAMRQQMLRMPTSPPGQDETGTEEGAAGVG